MTDERIHGRQLQAPEFVDDDGSADPALRLALSAYAQGVATGGDVLEALVATRVLVPVVAVLEQSETTADGLRVDKESSMATVTLQRPDGSRALLAFTGTASMAAWRTDARPVAVPARRAAQAALAEGAAALLVDVAGPRPFAVEGVELRSLAFAERAGVALPDDPDVGAAVAAVVADEPAVLGALLAGAVTQAAPPAPDPTGLRVTLVVRTAIGPEQFRALVPRVTQALARDLVLRSRVVGALQVAVVPPGQEPEGATSVFVRG